MVNYINKINSIRFADNFDSSIELDPITSSQLFIHFLHRCWGYLVFILILYFAYLLYKRTNFILLALILIGLISIQIGLGALTILSLKQFIITSLHVTNGAAILGLLVFTSLQLHKIKK